MIIGLIEIVKPSFNIVLTWEVQSLSEQSRLTSSAEKLIIHKFEKYKKHPRAGKNNKMLCQTWRGKSRYVCANRDLKYI